LPDIPSDQNDNALLAKAGSYYDKGKFVDAETIYRQLLLKFPSVPELRINLGAVLRAQGRLDLAEAVLQEAINLDPGQVGATYNLANVQRDSHQPAAAESSYRRCLELAPAFTDAAINLADMLSADGRVEDALAVLHKAVSITPGQAALWNNLGNALKDLGQPDAAEFHLCKAVELAPEEAGFKRNLAALYLAQGAWEAALSLLDTALLQDPDDADGHCLRAFARLASGDFSGGWSDYGWRWRSAEQEPRRPFPQALWDGSPGTGERLLIWGEQGIGDEIMYASILPDVMAASHRIALECDPRLQPLFARSFPDIRVFARKNPPDHELLSADWDRQLPLADLARHYRSGLPDFTNHQGFMRCQQGQRRHLRRRYQAMAAGCRLVGLAWKSRAGRTGLGRSLDLADLAPILTQPDTFFVNLQYGDVGPELEAIADLLGVEIYNDPAVNQMVDMDIYAAQIAALDLVVSAANTTVHVAGALGLPTKVLIPGVADWRWMSGRSDSPWYPSVQLFRKLPHQRQTEWLSHIAQEVF